MIWKVPIVMVLVTFTVIIQAIGLGVLLKFLMKWQKSLPTCFWPIIWLMTRVSLWLIAMHLIEISVWGFFYFWSGCLPDAESALYFSGVTYATIGYGDLVLPKVWRMLGPVEGLTGILMCGLSAAIFYTVLGRIYSVCAQAKRK